MFCVSKVGNPIHMCSSCEEKKNEFCAHKVIDLWFKLMLHVIIFPDDKAVVVEVDFMLEILKDLVMNILDVLGEKLKMVPDET